MINLRLKRVHRSVRIYIHLYRYWIKSVVLRRFELLTDSVRTASVNYIVTSICKTVKSVLANSHGVNLTEINKSYKFIGDQFIQLIEEEKKVHFFATNEGITFFKSLNLNRSDWDYLRMHVGDFPENTESVIMHNFIDPFESTSKK